MRIAVRVYLVSEFIRNAPIYKCALLYSNFDDINLNLPYCLYSVICYMSIYTLRGEGTRGTIMAASYLVPLNVLKKLYGTVLHEVPFEAPFDGVQPKPALG